MNRIRTYFRSLTSYDYTLFALIALSGGLTAWLYRASVVRAMAAFRDFGLSVAYYFCALFGYEEAVTPTVTVLPKFDVLRYLPYDFDEILRRLRDMWSCFFRGDCVKAYFQTIANLVNDWSVILMLLLPVLVCLWFILRSALLTPNQDRHGVLTNAMRRFEGRPLLAILAARGWLWELWHTLRTNNRYKWPLLLLWLLNFNVITLVVEILAYYFYFAMAFDFLNLISVQLAKLLLDVFILLAGAPLIFWLAVAYLLLRIMRKNMGYARLRHFEARNCDFIESQPICVLVCGLMGSKKTTAITDMALSSEIEFRNKALKLLMAQDSKFPNFPWINLEDELRQAFEVHQIFSLTTARSWIRKREEEFIEDPTPDKIFGYNILRYRYEYDNELKIETIWDALENYAQAYLIYTIQSSLILSNYSIRLDSVLRDQGNFPIWQNDFFGKSPAASIEDSHFAHILDYDLLRLGKQMLKDNPNRGSFEFGVVVITEVGKERGNSVTLLELKKKVDECNQKNDLFNYGLKMIRHKATVCGVPFVRVIADEQRAESLGADARDLYNVVHIRESSPFRLVMPLYFVEELIHDLIYPRFQSFLLQYKYNRGDICFSFTLLHNLASGLHNRYTNTYNLFGISEIKCDIEAGTLDGNLKKASYYISSKKNYSDRFSTDCHRQHFEILLRNALVGLDDYPTYETVIASAAEFAMQNSYFIHDMDSVVNA